MGKDQHDWSHMGFARTLLAVMLGSVALIAGARAASTNIDTTFTNAGSCTATSGCAESYGVTVLSGTTQTVTVPPSSSFAFANSFNQSGGISTGSNFGNSATGAGGPWNFQDNILFSTTTADVQVQAIASLTAVSDLQVRVISITNPATGNPWDITNVANIPSLLGGSSVVTIENGWTNFVVAPLGVDYTATMAKPLAAGSYILQIRGEAAAGSSYSGTADFSSVPLPSSWIMLLSGVGMLVLGRRQRTV